MVPYAYRSGAIAHLVIETVTSLHQRLRPMHTQCREETHETRAHSELVLTRGPTDSRSLPC